MDWNPCVETFPTLRVDKLAKITLNDPMRESTDVAANDAVLMLPARTADTDPMSALITADTDASFKMANDMAAIDPTVDALVHALLFTDAVFDIALMTDWRPLVDTLPTERTDTF